jgi:hypothetical protein
MPSARTLPDDIGAYDLRDEAHRPPVDLRAISTSATIRISNIMEYFFGHFSVQNHPVVQLFEIQHGSIL